MKYLTLVLAGILAIASLDPDRAHAQDNTSVEVNFIYAFELGFGSYKVGGLNVHVYGLPISYTFKEIFGHERLNLVVNAPVFYGRFRFRHKFEDGTKLKVDQDVISVIPGVELQYEVVDNWYLKPFVNMGGAWVVYDKTNPRGLNVDDSSIFLYTFGITSLYEIFWKRFTFKVGNRISWAGNTTINGDSEESYGVLENGFDVKHPLGFTIKGYEPDLSVFFNWYRFLPETKFDRFLRDPLIVKNQYEIAMTVGTANDLDLWVVKNPRIGVGYRFGDLKAFSVNFGFPF